MPQFHCSQCGYSKPVTEVDFLGKKARCPKCKEIGVITDDPVVADVIELKDDDEANLLGMDLRGEDFVDDEFDESITEDLPPRKMKREESGPGIPKPRSFLTTALLAGGLFGVGMGLFVAFKSGATAGILVGLVSGPLFGFVMAFFVSGRRIVVRFENRRDFIRDMKRAFKKNDHEVIDLSDPLFTFKHSEGAAFLCTSYVHVGQTEAVFVGPRAYVTKCVRDLSDRHDVEWAGRKMKENHGEATPDRTAQYAWLATGVVLFLLLSGLKEGSSPEGKARAYVRSRLKSPSEAKFISTKVISRGADGTRIEVVFEAPNSFGARLRDSMTVVVESDGTVASY